MLSNNGLCLCAAVQYVLLFLVNNFDRFQIYGVIRSYSSCPFLCALVTVEDWDYGRVTTFQCSVIPRPLSGELMNFLWET